MSIERRHAPCEFRAAAAGTKLEGYAAVFASPARIGQFVESIRAGAFRTTLANKTRDVLALVDHDSTRLLARTSSGTLRLAEDTRGLHFSLDIPDTTLGRDVRALAERGDLGGMSLGFDLVPGGDFWASKDIREIRAVRLFEVSVINAFAAYQATSIAIRSIARAAADARIREMRLASL